LQTALSKEAWEIIANPEKVIDMPQLAIVINSLGISETKDLLYCDEKEIIQIGMLVKKVPRRRFFQIFGMSPDLGLDLSLDGELERDVAAALEADDDDDDDEDKSGHLLLQQQAQAQAVAQQQAYHQLQQQQQQYQQHVHAQQIHAQQQQHLLSQQMSAQDNNMQLYHPV